MCHSSFVEVRGQLGKLILSSSHMGPWGLNSGCLIWQQWYLPAEPSLISALRNASYTSSQPTY